MPNGRPYRRSFFAIGVIAALCLVGAASPAAARTGPSTAPVRVVQLDGFVAPGTPDQYNKVGIIETGPKAAKNVLVLVPGTSASAAYFEPIARDIVAKNPGWQVWAVEQRENLLEDHSVLDEAKAGHATTVYATWDFGGAPGARDLAGLVYIDGGSRLTPVTPDAATAARQALDAGSPWLTFGGIKAPYAGLFNAVGSTTVHLEPNAPSRLQTWPVLPANLKAPVPTTAVASYGYALDVGTSPPGLAAAQAHLGHLAASGDPRGWDRAGALTPVARYADMFSGTGIPGHDGTAWYHPMRLTIDAGADADGNANPAQQVLDVHATHRADLPKRLHIYAFGAALGGTAVLDEARTLAAESGIPSGQLVLVDHHDTYSHNDPSAASPTNAFLQNLTPFLHEIGS